MLPLQTEAAPLKETVERSSLSPAFADVNLPPTADFKKSDFHVEGAHSLTSTRLAEVAFDFHFW
jgi:hypothetical protein